MHILRVGPFRLQQLDPRGKALPAALRGLREAARRRRRGRGRQCGHRLSDRLSDRRCRHERGRCPQLHGRREADVEASPCRRRCRCGRGRRAGDDHRLKVGHGRHDHRHRCGGDGDGRCVGDDGCTHDPQLDARREATPQAFGARGDDAHVGADRFRVGEATNAVNDRRRTTGAPAPRQHRRREARPHALRGAWRDDGVRDNTVR